MSGEILKDIRLKRVRSDKYGIKGINKQEDGTIAVGGCEGG